MKAEDRLSRRETLSGWPVQVVSYRLGDRYHCAVDNVEPGAVVARAEGATREEAEKKALEDAGRRLARTRVRG